MTSKGIVGLSLFVSLLLSGHHELSSFQFPLPHTSIMMYCATTGPKQQDEPIMNWNFYNCEPKGTFPLFRLIVLDIVLWYWKLTNTPASQSVFRMAAWHSRRDIVAWALCQLYDLRQDLGPLWASVSQLLSETSMVYLTGYFLNPNGVMYSNVKGPDIKQIFRQF
jgi:hypothetical protein